MSILSEPENPYDFFNIRFPHIEELGMVQYKAFWLHTDIDYSKDGKDFEKLSKNEKLLIENTIGFFFSSDGLVFKNLGENFKSEIKDPSVQFMYTAFEAMETLHSKSYGTQLDSIISDPKRKRELMQSIVTIPSVKKMTDWAIEQFDKKYLLLDRLIANLSVEGIFFSSPFANIFWLRKYLPSKLPGIVGANDLISRDENIHCEGGVLLINTLKKEGHKSEREVEIFTSAVNVALEFAKETLPEGMIDMNYDLMAIHIKSVANRWGLKIGLPLLYGDCKQSPFKWIENLSLEIKKNFFEKDATEYQHAPPMLIDYNGDTTDF